MIYQLAFDTFIGARTENQDSILNVKIAEDVFLVGIADGMGGVKGGKLASSLAIDAIKDYVQSLTPNQFESEKLKEILSSCYDIAGFSIRMAIDSQPEYKGMGTTLSLLLICEDMYVWSNIGDSRIYKIEGEEMNLLTVDHTLMQQLTDEEKMEVIDTASSNYDHILTKCLDGSDELPDIFPLDKDFETLSGEVYFLLCSDGLILDKMETDQSRLRQIVTQKGSVQDAVTDLISHAYSRGSKDNISVGVVHIHENPAQAYYLSEQKKSKWLKIYYGVIYLILAMVVLFAGWTFVQSLRDYDTQYQRSTFQHHVHTDTEKNSKWRPLDDQDKPQSIVANEKIFWEPYPDTRKIRYYHVSILSGDEMIMEKYFKGNQNHLSTRGLELVETRYYTLIVDAITNNNTRIEGNSMDFTVSTERNQSINQPTKPTN